MSVAAYDPAQVGIVVGGSLITGFAPDTFIGIDQNNDSFTLQMGADGDAARSKSNDRSATITLSLLQTSLSNDVLSALHNLDINSPSGDGIGAFQVRDNSGNLLVRAAKCWVRKPPTVEMGREAGVREWTLETDRIDWVNIGGTPSA